MVFLPRHGRAHSHSPSTLNYRANIYALKSLGVTHVLSVSAVGSLREEIAQQPMRKRADAAGLRDQRIVVLHRIRVAGQAGYVQFEREPFGGRFVAERVDRLGRRSDEHQAGIAQRAGEVRPLRQEAVARMDRLCAAVAAGRDDAADVEVALPGRPGADPDRDVGHHHVARRRVGIGMDSDRPDAECPGAADHPAGDLAAVGDQQRIEPNVEARHAIRPVALNPAAAGCPSSSR